MPVALLLAVLSSLTTEGRTVALLSPPAPHQVLLAQADAPPAGASASELRDYYRKRAAEPKAEGAPSAPPVVSAPHAVAAQPSVQYEVIRTKDGLVYTGQTVREMEKGILFRGADGETTLIEYGNIADMQRPGGAPPGVSSEAAAKEKARANLEHQVASLRLERGNMISGWVALGLLAGGTFVLLFASGLVGIVLIAAGLGEVWYFLGAAASLDTQIRTADDKLRNLSAVPPLIPSGRGLVLARF